MKKVIVAIILAVCSTFNTNVLAESFEFNAVKDWVLKWCSYGVISRESFPFYLGNSFETVTVNQEISDNIKSVLSDCEAEQNEYEEYEEYEEIYEDYEGEYIPEYDGGEESETEETNTATISVEAFTVGGGYIVDPVEVEFSEGDSLAYVLDEVLTDYGLYYDNSGSLDEGFYLSSIYGIEEFTPLISQTLQTCLTDAGFDCDTDSYISGQLCEFDFTSGSGWMYCVNNEFADMGFSEYYLQDGDTVRVQFTLAYGADIGGISAAASEYMSEFFETVNRDELTKRVAQLGAENCEEYMSLITKPELSEDELNLLLENLN